MKPRFNLSFYPLKGGCLYLILTEFNRYSLGNGVTTNAYYRTTLDAEETAAFWKY